MIYLRARWYDPTTGRFLTQDPFAGLSMAPTTQHPYAYVGNNAINWVDPSGYCWGPAAFLRQAPGYDVMCGNLDMAIFIAGHPQATAYQKAQAVAYVEAVAVSHIVLAEALVIGGYGWLVEGGAIGGKILGNPNECSGPSKSPICYPADPTQSPGAGWEWRGSGSPGSPEGAWFNPETKESLHPDLSHPVHGPHWDYTDRVNKIRVRIFPDGSKMEK